ncbi:MAG: DUF429 domain-containing protein [Actinomycetota bacterium]|nr:DUF429 domain-containing protein [Actinomycetota bacterium]
MGIDLSASPKNTGVVKLSFEGNRLSVQVQLQADDTEILGWLEKDFVAIDAPFGWPIAFNQVIGSWMSSEPRWLPEEGSSARGEKEWDEDKELLKFRLTDRFVRHHLRDEHKKKSEHKTLPKLQRRHKNCDWPLGLAVAAEKIAITSFRAVPLLHRAHIDDRTGMTGSAIEVYPGSALAEWCMYVTYKDTAGEDNRAELCDAISKQIRSGIRNCLDLDHSSLDDVSHCCRA